MRDQIDLDWEGPTSDIPWLDEVSHSVRWTEEAYAGVTFHLPARRVLCPRCDGEGKHVNPAVDEGGLTREDFDNDPGFEEAYFSGVYDVVCYQCKGKHWVLEVDEEGTNCRVLHLWNKSEQERHEMEAMVASERRYGA